MSSLRDLRRCVLAVVLCVPAAVPSGAALAQDAKTLSLNPMTSYPKAKLKSFVEAPLFDPSRRLPPAPVAFQPMQPALAVEQPPALQLIGVIQGANAVAIVRNAGKTDVLHTGDHLGGWTVEVLPLGLRVRSGLRVYDYAMFKLRGQAGPLAVEPTAALAATQPAIEPEIAARNPRCGKPAE